MTYKLALDSIRISYPLLAINYEHVLEFKPL